MPSFKVKYQTVVEAWTVIDCASEAEAREAIERGRFTGSTNIGDRIVEIDYVETTHDKPEAWIPKKAIDPANKGTALMPAYDVAPEEPRHEADSPDLPDVGEVIGEVIKRMEGSD